MISEIILADTPPTPTPAPTPPLSLIGVDWDWEGGDVEEAWSDEVNRKLHYVLQTHLRRGLFQNISHTGIDDS